ncbi:MAG: hypothetical protein JXA25_20645 [Anaerolineales bacterium]|nr:hypothetical protein [Anaerolineales bacterium]
MPYCVNCGVELEKRERCCPLCGVPVIVPDGVDQVQEGRLLPPGRDEYSTSTDRQLIFYLITIALAVPALISLTINLLINSRVTWSLVVVGSLAAAWVVFVSPLLYRRRVFPLWIVFDMLAAAGLLYLIETTVPTKGWFRPLALPVTVWVGAVVLVLYKLIERRALHGLQIVSGVFIAIGVLSLFIDGTIQEYLYDSLRPGWSLIVLIPCIAVAAIFALIQRKQQFVDRMERWFHY